MQTPGGASRREASWDSTPSLESGVETFAILFRSSDPIISPHPLKKTLALLCLLCSCQAGALVVLTNPVRILYIVNLIWRPFRLKKKPTRPTPPLKNSVAPVRVLNPPSFSLSLSPSPHIHRVCMCVGPSVCVCLSYFPSYPRPVCVCLSCLQPSNLRRVKWEPDLMLYITAPRMRKVTHCVVLLVGPHRQASPYLSVVQKASV